MAKASTNTDKDGKPDPPGGERTGDSGLFSPRWAPGGGKPSANAERVARRAWVNRLAAATTTEARTLGALFREVGAPLDAATVRALALKVAIFARNPGDLGLDDVAELHVVTRAGAAAALASDDVLIGILHRLARGRKARAHTLAELVQAVPTHQKAAIRAALTARVKERRWPPGVGAISATRSTLVFLLADVAGPGITPASAPAAPAPAPAPAPMPVRAPPFDEAFDSAFERIQGPRGLNLVSLAALRQALPAWDRDGFDRELRRLRAADRVVLHTFDGRHGKLDDAEVAGAITEGGRRFVYAARREP